jgi:uncharacterized protein HemX
MRKPSLNDALIMSNVRYAGAPAVNTAATDAITRSAAQDFATQSAMGQRQRAIDTSRERFDKTMGLQRQDLDTQKALIGQANLASMLGLGVSGVQAYQGRKQAAQQKQMLNELRSRLKKNGDSNSLLIADLLSIFKNF